jgi:hypothetical protein
MLSLALHHPEYGDAGEHHDTQQQGGGQQHDAALVDCLLAHEFPWCLMPFQSPTPLWGSV